MSVGVDAHIDPYGHTTLLPHIVRACRCVLRGRGKPLPYVTTKRGAAQKQEPFPSSVSLRLTASPQWEAMDCKKRTP